MNRNQSTLRKTGAVLIAAVIMASSALPVWAADRGADKLVIQLKTGSAIAVINGQEQRIAAKPYMEKGTTMVPLGVFNKAFGSEVRLEKTNVIKVMYGPHTVSLTIGSTVAWVDGHKIILDTAPTMASGTLMVPLRVVAKGIGATINSGKANEINISLVPTDNDVVVDPGIDNDLGKTKIGNSFYQWTMNYPSGLVLGSGDEDESVASFSDAEDNYYIEVHANDQEVQLSAADLLEQLVEDAKDSGETVLDREAFPQAKVPYARIIAKDSDGTYWECRQYYNNDRLYEVYFADTKASNYKDLSKYAGLLNSFDTGFNVSDKAVKDLSTVKNGMRSAFNDDYGISLNVPAGWSMDHADMYYESKEGSYLKLNVSSAPKGSTLDQWSGQLKTWLEESFVPESYQFVKTYPIQISGEDGIVNEVRYNYGDGWITEYEVMIQKNGYRYYTEYAVPEDQKDDLARFKPLMDAIHIDFDVVTDTFGNLEEDSFLTAKSKKVTKTSKAFQYKIDIPQYWTAVHDKFEKSPVEYQFTGGRFLLTVEKTGTVEATVSQLKSYYNEAAKTQKDFKIVKIEEITFAGVTATSFTLHQVKDDIPYVGRQLVFQKNGKVYTLTASLNDANATTLQKDTLDSTLNSFEFTK
ncbi:copper amine oxidase N-terminal domain-containing protein [Paenibacillus pini]|uniref:Copper amine oxidase n=1 Tax=Paenibacillus pini JCM 16418 TaxID=1236976 RepID=W7YHD3_9BACL|nr:copper amine oxidase N-terminal domain-containing protein [Paenibacillus pini]GAF10325.1 copper amine oxidase [Paenibacillus pini JCM 16418]